MSSKLSAPLKTLISASHAKPHTLPAPPHITSIYDHLATAARTKNVAFPAWLTLSAAATFTLNSPASLLALYNLATSPQHRPAAATEAKHGIYTAELMREIGLKCIGLNGVPRTINCLGDFTSNLPANIRSELAKRPARRNLNTKTIPTTLERGNWLWDRIYHPFTDKLTAKLAQSHPDLPVFIVEGEYGALFSDPAEPALDPTTTPNVGRVLTSIFAVAVLRAQTGVGPQIVSHLFGLRKAFEDGTAKAEPIEGGEWLASDEGNIWLLEQVDKVVEGLGGSNFAAGHGPKEKAKL